MNVSEISDFREYVEEQQHLCYGVELGGTPAVVGSLARQYDFLLETIDTYQEIKQPQLNENQQVVLDWLKNRYTGNADPFGVAACLFSQTPRSEVIVATLKLTRDEQAQVLKIFANWTLEQEEDL